MNNAVITENSSLDLTLNGIFPDKSDASNDKKCLIISKLYQEMSQHLNMSRVTQEEIKKEAQGRYAYLSREKRLEIVQIDHAAFLLFQKGVKPETIRAYFAYRLTENDAKSWHIHIC